MISGYVYIKIKQNLAMIIGKISEGEEIVKFNEQIHCTDCNKTVPGGIATSEKYYQTESFKIELEKQYYNVA